MTVCPGARIAGNPSRGCARSCNPPWWSGAASIRGPRAFQARALPTELPDLVRRTGVADLTGFEPATSGLTGRRALQTAPQVPDRETVGAHSPPSIEDGDRLYQWRRVDPEPERLVIRRAAHGGCPPRHETGERLERSSPAVDAGQRQRCASTVNVNGQRQRCTPEAPRTPNGIRTRVTALKGRRPGPLDDGGSTPIRVRRDYQRGSNSPSGRPSSGRSAANVSMSRYWSPPRYS